MHENINLHICITRCMHINESICVCMCLHDITNGLVGLVYGFNELLDERNYTGID